MSAPKLKVLISGAGIAGPCLANWLSKTRLDISITIIERSPSPRTTGQSIDIRGSADRDAITKHAWTPRFESEGNNQANDGTTFPTTTFYSAYP